MCRVLTALIVLVAMLGAATIAVPTPAFGQQNPATEGKPPVGGPRKQLATIIYAGLGGAVLGLSTLSFYGRPQDKLANIAIGFAVGVILGTGFVTYSAAANPDEFYGPSEERHQGWRYEAPEFSLASLEQSRAENARQTPVQVSYEFRF